MNDVNLSISSELVNPIIKQKVNSIVLEALGGGEELIAKVVDEIINTDVDKDGRKTNCSYDVAGKWLDVVVTNQIKEAVQGELQKQITESSSAIKEALIQQIRSKRGSNMVAKALMDGLDETFKSSWMSKISVGITCRSAE